MKPLANTLVQICTVTFLFFLPQIQAQQFDLQWSHVEYQRYLGSANMICQDIDGDGLEEIVFDGGTQFGQHLFVAHIENGDLKNDWTSPWIYSSPIVSIQIGNFNQDPDQEIYAILGNGNIQVYDGTSRELIDSYTINPGSWIYKATIANVDLDPNPEIVLSLENGIKVYDLITQQLEWERNSIVLRETVVGDVDGDGVPDVVFSGSTPSAAKGYVLDGVTGNTKWEYLGSFGSPIALSNVDNDPELEILGANGSKITYFDGGLHSPIGQITANSGFCNNMIVKDINGDGQNEIVASYEGGMLVRAYNAVSKQLLWTIPDLTNSGSSIAAIAVGDMDRDGTIDIGWGTASGLQDYLYFYNTESLLSILKSRVLDAPFVMDAGKVGFDGALQYFIGSAGNSYGNFFGHILQYDAGTQNLINDISDSEIGPVQQMKLVHSRDQDKAEVVVNAPFTILDPVSKQILYNEHPGWSAQVIQNADLDGDGNDEIIIGDGNNTIGVYQYNNGSYTKTWESISYNGNISSLLVVNVDDDPALEFVFNVANAIDTGIIQIIDSETKILQGQMQSLSGYKTWMDIGDLDADGALDLIICNGIILKTFSLLTQQQTGSDHIFNNPIRAIALTNVDSTARQELVVFDDRLKVLNSETYEIRWQSDLLSTNPDMEVSMRIYDLLDDQHLDILVASNLGAFHFSSVGKIIDVKPPRVLVQTPAPGAKFQEVSSAVKIRFSEQMNQSLLQEPNILIKDKAGNIQHYVTAYDNISQILTCQPITPFSGSDTITVFLSAQLADPSQNTLDGNRNGMGTGGAEDNVTWSFTTGSGIDTIGPKIFSASLNPTETFAGMQVILNASISDFSTVALSGVEYAEFFLDQPGPNGQGIPISALDGHWGDVTEHVKPEIQTYGLPSGLHSLYIHARDLRGNWGDWVELDLTIREESIANWPMFGQNPQHTNYNQNCGLEPQLNLKWTKNYNGKHLEPVVYANGRLFVATSNLIPSQSELFALDTFSGTKYWSYSFNDATQISAAAYAYGRVFIQAYKPYATKLAAINFNNGENLWETWLDSEWEKYLGPTIADGKIYFVGSQIHDIGGLRCYDALTYKLKWFWPSLPYTKWAPTYYQNILYTFLGGALKAFDANTGLELWTKTLPYDLASYELNMAPVIDTVNKLIIVASDSYMNAVRLENQTVAWEVFGLNNVTPALSNGVLYIIRNGKLEARQAATGALVWTFAGDNQLSYPPTLTDGYVYVSSANQVYAVELSTGLKKWSYPAGGALTLAENLLVVTSPENVVRVFEHGLSSAVQETAPVDFGLSVAPNPVRETARIGFTLPHSMKACILISDLEGRMVAQIGETPYAAGEHFVTWNPGELPAGIYRCSFVAEAFSNTCKILLAGH